MIRFNMTLPALFSLGHVYCCHVMSCRPSNPACAWAYRSSVALTIRPRPQSIFFNSMSRSLDRDVRGNRNRSTQPENLVYLPPPPDKMYQQVSDLTAFPFPASTTCRNLPPCGKGNSAGSSACSFRFKGPPTPSSVSTKTEPDSTAIMR